MNRNSVRYGVLPLEIKKECHFCFTTETPRNHKDSGDLSLLTLTNFLQDKLEFLVKHAEKRLLKILALFVPQESHGFYTKGLIREKEETSVILKMQY